jgi:glycosyltransferase involved in cell wall biosynthesis
MKIVHFHRHIRLEKGGVVRAVLDLCAALAEAGHELTVLTTDARDAPADWREGEAGHPRLVAFRRPLVLGGLFAARTRRNIATYLEGADVLHLHGMWDPLNIPCAAAARSLGLPYVLSTHGMLDDWALSVRSPKKRFFLAAFGNRVLDAAAAVHCTAQAELEQSRKRLPRDNGVVIPLVIDLSPFRDPPGPQLARETLTLPADDRPTILFLSRLHFVKGVSLLIEAVDSLRAEGVDCNLLIAGTGEPDYEATLKRQARERGLADRVRFLGFVSGREKMSLYEAADVFCLPSRHENFGMVWAESLACGTPVVTTKGIGAWPDLESGGGTLIVPRTAEGFGGAIKRLVRDPELRRALGERGRQWVFSFLDTPRIVAGYESLYADAISRAASPADRGARTGP